MHSNKPASSVRVCLLLGFLMTLCFERMVTIAFQCPPPSSACSPRYSKKTSLPRGKYTNTASLIKLKSPLLSSSNKAGILRSANASDNTEEEEKEEAEEESSISDKKEDCIPVDVAVIGGGPAGLLSCIMLAQKLGSNTKKTTAPTIHLYESSPTPPAVDDLELWETDVARFYSLGVFGRGRKALEAFGVWDDVQRAAVEMRGNQRWDNNNNSSNNSKNKQNKKGTPIVSLLKDRGRDNVFALPRDKLVAVLHEHILKHYSCSGRINLNFGCQVKSVDLNDGTKPPVLVVTRKDSVVATKPSGPFADISFCVKADLLVGADGAARSVANQMEQSDQEDYKKQTAHLKVWQRMRVDKPFRVKRYVDDNKRVYKTIALQLPNDWRHDLGYQNNSNDGRYAIVSLPAADGGKQCAVLLLKSDDPLAKANTDAKDVRNMLNKYFPQFSAIIGDEEIERVAKKPPSNFPLFRYAGPRLHYGTATVVLGDAIHTVKPYNGLGVNTAFEDVHILGNILDKTQNITAAIEEFSKRRADDAKAVVKISRAQDRPGKLFFLSFVLPIIIDSFFHKLAPKIFAPPTPALMQDDNYSFHQVASRKRRDRIMQASVIGVLATFTVKAIIAAFKRIMVLKHLA